MKKNPLKLDFDIMNKHRFYVNGDKYIGKLNF